MTRRRHLAALFAPVAALLLAACAAQSPPVSSAPPMADASIAKGDAPRREVSEGEVEGQIAAMSVAEDQIGRAIHRWPAAAQKDGDKKKAEEQERTREPSSLATASPTTPAAPKVGQASGSFRAGDDGLGGADPCVTACSALSSMERAARHLCDLTGDGDERCDSARSRVSGATERVTASCPACSPGN
jgi:hypothetical protein